MLFLTHRGNGVGNAISASAKLQINSPVHFSKNFEVVKGVVGDKVNLFCDVKGDETIHVSWAKDREPIRASSPKFMQEDTISKNSLSSRLFIRAASASDSGFFTCLAWNPYGR